ncbi:MULTISPECIES: TldD/PmbA family protein [Vibrio]|uniref:TldD/PmbA family protein n=1 Tax=Vibrio TaxID=662 RepID=UPI0005F03049|nr:MULTISPECIES: TldD/PmbA family protein [Vibrio]KJR21278.1 Zn-dependent protease [Vibrio sp. S234-5]MBE4603843.1 Zn-dependent protease [Vibrio navarrensis]
MDQKQHLLTAIDHLLTQAKAKGAQADIVAQTSDNFSLKASKGQLDEYKVSTSQVIGVRVVKDDRVATSYSESLATESLDLMLNNALESAKYAKVDPKQKISVIDSQLTADYPELNQACDATVDDKIALSLRLEQGVVSRPHASNSPYNGYSDVTSQVLIANTQGSLCQQTERYHSAYAYTLFEKDGKQSMAGAMSLGRRYIDLDPEYCIDAGYEQARDLLDGAPVKTGNYSVLFTIDTLSELFGAFSACFSASSAMKGFNPLRDKIGAAIANPLLTVSSQAYVEGGFRIRRFDSEGTAAQDLVIVGAGELHSLLHNSYTAAYFGVANTGHASRGPKDSLEVSAHHTVIGSGNSSFAEVTAGEYLELVDLQGAHSGADFISGDFSFGASGFLCRDGKRVQPVRGITVAGNFYQMLKEIEAVGSLVEANDSYSFYSPKIRFARLSIGGK